MIKAFSTVLLAKKLFLAARQALEGMRNQRDINICHLEKFRE